MKYCTYCGAELRDEAVVCPRCGCPCGPQYSRAYYPPPEPDIPSTGLNVLSFFFPIVGLILYIVYSDKAPLKARAIGKWALIGFCVGVGLVVLLYAIFFAALGLMFI